MDRRSMVSLMFGIAMGFVPVRHVSAAEATETVISVPGMHCEGCAKSVVAKLVEVRGVAKATSNMESKTIKLVPKSGVVLSPKSLWEAVEKAKKTPTKLEGPSGSFTSKPTK